MSHSVNDLTEGNIAKNLIAFSLPFFFTSLIQSLYNVVDVLIVGQFCGSEGVAGTSIGGSLTMTVIHVIISLCNGGAIMTAQYAGMKSEKDIKDTISTMFTVMLVLAVISTVVMVVFTDPCLRMLNTPEEAYEQTRAYYLICTLGSIFIFGYNAVGSVMRGLGDSKTPMYFGFVSCVVNIVLDLLFVAAFHWEAAGAAAATVISQAVALIGCVIYLIRKQFIFDFRPSSFYIDKEKAVTIMRLGFPQAVQSFIVSGGFLMVSTITNSLGVSAASGVAIASKVNNFAQMPAGAFGTATSTMVGQNVGARKYDRASKTLKISIAISLAVGVVAFVIVQAFPRFFMGLLINDPEVIETAVPYLRMTAIDYLLVALVHPLNALCNGSGHTAFTMIPSIVSSVVARVPVAYFCVYVLDMGLAGVGLSTPTGTTSAILLCTWFYLSGRWKKSVID